MKVLITEQLPGGAAQIGWTGGLIAATVLGAGIWAEVTDRPWQTIVFATLGLAQLALALALRAPRRRGGSDGHFLNLAVAGALAAQLAAIYLAPLRELLSTDRLALGDLAAAFAIAALPAVVVRVVNRWRSSATESRKRVHVDDVCRLRRNDRRTAL